MMSLVTSLIQATSDIQRPLSLYKTRGPITQETIQRGKAATSSTYILGGAKGLLHFQGKQRCVLHVVCGHVSLPRSLSLSLFLNVL